MNMLQEIYPYKSVNNQPMDEITTDILKEFKRLKLVVRVRTINKIAYIEILQTSGSIKFAHNATSLLSILQMYEIRTTTN